MGMARQWKNVLGASAVALAASGCSLIVEADEVQCSVNSDCAARGFDNGMCVDDVCVAQSGSSSSTGPSGSSSGASSDASSTGDATTEASSSGGIGDGPWDCLGHIVWPEEQEDTPASVGLHFTNAQFEPYEGATLQACRPLDLECDEPYSVAMSDANGDVFGEVYYGFDGYFRSPPPADEPDLYPFIIYALPPPFSVETEVRHGDVLLINEPTVQALAGLSGVEIVPDTGFIFFTALDCNEERASDIVVSISPVSAETVVAYLDGGFPNPDLTSTVDVGQGAVLNVPPGLVEVTGTSLEHGKIFETTVLVEANTVTGLPIVPMPM